MTAIDIYHNYIGDQGKNFAEILRWGTIMVRMKVVERGYEKHTRQLRSQARHNLNRRVPELRLHISGEYYVH